VPSKKIYFASDFHLGVPDYNTSLEREKKIIRWLDTIKSDAEIIYLVGDVFDFWFEYKTVVPKNYVRLLGKLAEITDSGVQIKIFTGNHDMWLFDYFEKELNIPIIRNPIVVEHQGKKLFIGHGDGLGPGDYGYKFIKKIFSNKFCQWLFARLHPNFGIGMANFWSKKSRTSNAIKETFLGEDQEWLLIYSKEIAVKQPDINYFIFGHRHLPLDIRIHETARYVNLGEWINFYSYACLKDGELLLEYFNEEHEKSM